MLFNSIQMDQKRGPLVPNLDVFDIWEESGNFCFADMMATIAPKSDNNVAHDNNDEDDNDSEIESGSFCFADVAVTIAPEAITMLGMGQSSIKCGVSSHRNLCHFSAHSAYFNISRHKVP